MAASVLSTIADLLATGALIRQVNTTLGLRSTFRQLGAVPPPPNPKHLPPPRLTIIIPVYREERIISETCAFYAEALRELPHIELVICGTARERDLDRNPTLDIAREALLGVRGARVIEYPQSNGFKVDQLNFALDVTQGVGASEYVAVFDVDSRPEPGTFEEFTTAALSRPDVVQQHALFVKNLPSLEGKPLQIGQAFYQSRWTIAHEVPRFRLYSAGLSPFVHLIGHGMFVRRELLKEYGGFPTGTTTDDAHIGFFVTADRRRIVSIRAFDISDNPTNWAETSAQLYGWSRGPFDAAVYARSYLAVRGASASRTRAYISALVCFWFWLQWALTSFVLIALILSALSGGLIAACVLALYATEMHIAVRFVQMRTARHLNPTLLTGQALLFALISSVPALSAFWDVLTRRHRSKYKSTHEAT